MTTLKELLRPTLRIVIGALAAVCAAWGIAGGGVDSGGTGSPTNSYSSGRLSGFGSIVLNGVHFDETRALVLDDEGGLHRRDSLKLGMTLAVRAGAIDTDVSSGMRRAVAERIVFASAIRGPVQAVSAGTSSLTVFGQKVAVNEATVFDARVGGMAGVRPGQVLEIHALLDESNGRYLATRIDRPDKVSTFKLRGVVSRLDNVARSLVIGGVRVGMEGVDAAGLPRLAEGSIVTVLLRPNVGKGGVWQMVSASAAPTPDRDTVRVDVDAMVSDYEGLASFRLAGTPVNAAAAGVSFVDGTNGQLANGVRVFVSGRMFNGVLVADSVTYRKGGTNRQGEEDVVSLHGEIESVNLADHSFVLRGNTVAFDAKTSFANGRPSTLQAGTEVDVAGYVGRGGTGVGAASISFGPMAAALEASKLRPVGARQRR